MRKLPSELTLTGRLLEGAGGVGPVGLMKAERLTCDNFASVFGSFVPSITATPLIEAPWRTLTSTPVVSPSLMSMITGSLIYPAPLFPPPKGSSGLARTAYLPGKTPNSRNSPFGPDRAPFPEYPPAYFPSFVNPPTTISTPATGCPAPTSTTRPKTSRVCFGSGTVMSTSVASDPSLTSIAFASDSLVTYG